MTYVGALLLLLWSLSPIGGQASLRALERVDRTTYNVTTIAYLHTGAGSLREVAGIHGNDTVKLEMASQLFVSLLTAPIDMKTSPRDNWGNVRVPRLEMLAGAPNATTTDDSDGGWRAIPAKIALPEQYASLVRLLIGGIPAPSPGIAVNFTVEVSYMTLDSSSCTPWERDRCDCKFSTYFGQVWNALGQRVGNCTCANSSSASLLPNEVSTAEDDYWRPFYKEPHANQTYPPYRRPDTLIFLDTAAAFHPTNSFGEFTAANTTNAVNRQSDGGDARVLHLGSLKNATVSMTSCPVSEMHVEVAIRCAGDSECNCRATHIRRSRSDTRPGIISPLDSKKTAVSLLRHIAFAAPHGLLELALYDPAAPLLKGSQPDLRDRSPALVADRLTTLLNTYYMLFAPRKYSAYMGDYPSANASDFGYDYYMPLTKAARVCIEDQALQGEEPGDSDIYRLGCRWFCARTADATVAHTVQVYTYSGVWLTLLFVSAGAVLLTGMAGAVMAHLTRAPDMLGYAASMTYNNPYLVLPDDDICGSDGDGGGNGSNKNKNNIEDDVHFSDACACDEVVRPTTRGKCASLLNAKDRARALRNVQVSLGDVRGDELVGRVAFATGIDVRPLAKGRLYT
jgi:hypothetical protein